MQCTQRRKVCTNSNHRLKLLLAQGADGLALTERAVIAINDSPVQSYLLRLYPVEAAERTLSIT